MRSTLRRGAVVAFGAAAVLSLGLGSAMADPFYANDGSELPGGFHPDSDDLVGTGSDTIQYVTNELSRGYSFGTQRLASFNAFKPGTESSDPIVIHDDIIIRDPDQVPDSGDEVVIPRPNGSSEGISTLLTNSTVNFARSSRAQDESKPAEETLSFIPFANDGLSYMIDDISDVPTNLTAANLRDIYTCELPGFAAKLPQPGSGTRAFFLQQIGVSETEIAAAVAAGCVDDQVQEHDAAAVDGDSLAIAPISTARYGTNPVGSPPSDSVTLASDVDPGAFLASRPVYHVVRDTEVNDADIQAVFGPGGLICGAVAAGGEEQGFTAIPNCGIPD